MPHDDEMVGYGRPPKRTRFQKGQSGNRRGRPKGVPNLATVLARTLKEPVVITERGRKKTITKFEAAAKQLVNKAASGEARAIAQLFAHVQVMERHVDAPDPATQPLPEADQLVMARMLIRLTRQAQEGGAPHGPDTEPV
jgi:uncharacterized protein DUF5681